MYTYVTCWYHVLSFNWAEKTRDFTLIYTSLWNLIAVPHFALNMRENRDAWFMVMISHHVHVNWRSYHFLWYIMKKTSFFSYMIHDLVNFCNFNHLPSHTICFCGVTLLLPIIWLVQWVMCIIDHVSTHSWPATHR